MISIVLYSADLKLQSLLASALKPEYCVVLETDKTKIRHAIAASSANVLVLDFDSNITKIDQQIALYEEIGEVGVPILVMTDDLRRSTAMEFVRRGARDCIRRPPSLIEFKVNVERANEHALMKRELEEMRRRVAPPVTCDRLIGLSGGMLAVYDLVRRVSDLNASVLITGESGTGKELVARAIHNTGDRASRPFVAVSCGAIPESLIEAELFGHERGAFTGAAAARAGFLEQASGGTLFLDEIGELSLNTQVKLLRVLQQREFTRLGSNRLIPLTARLVFATHQDLGQMADAGTFRKDLFYRVNVMNIHVPPLRERPEDIPSLAHHFLKKYAAEYGSRVNDVQPNVMDVLGAYDWPGNVRELENVIQTAIIRADGTSLRLADLPDVLGHGIEESDEDPGAEGFEAQLRNFKVNLALRAVAECNGNKTLAAKKLHVSRAYLHRLIRSGAEEPQPISPVRANQMRAAASVA